MHDMSEEIIQIIATHGNKRCHDQLCTSHVTRPGRQGEDWCPACPSSAYIPRYSHARTQSVGSQQEVMTSRVCECHKSMMYFLRAQ